VNVPPEIETIKESGKVCPYKDIKKVKKQPVNIVQKHFINSPLTLETKYVLKFDSPLNKVSNIFSLTKKKFLTLSNILLI